jgi:Flp pilus assembly protein TadD
VLPLAVCALLLAATFAVFSPLATAEFVNFDDDVYVTGNAMVRAGLTGAGLRWAFQTFHGSNWHPLTWVSHMLDVELFGLAAGAHHMVSVAIHAGNAVLLFLVLRGLTGALWRSGLVAALFAVHPLHVESVAWVAERKDVLSALLWLLAMSAYLGYVRRPGWGRYLAVVGLFALGLLAKPMVVTLPCALLLLDYWPLGRLAAPGERRARVIAEKLPLLGLAALSAAVTVHAQAQGGVVRTLKLLPFAERVQNALVSGVAYLGATLWPARLAVFYPLPKDGYPAWQVAAAAAVLALLAAAAVRGARAFPAGLVGLLWAAGTLVPVLGLVQVGGQVRADRYMYLPLIGLFIAVAWGAAALPRRATAKAPAALLALAALAAASREQVSWWHDSASLFAHARSVAPASALVENNLGLALAERGDPDGAAVHYREALRLDPTLAGAYNNLGVLSLRSGKVAEAESLLRRAVDLDPHGATAHSSLGLLLEKQGRHDEAIAQLSRAVAIQPDDPVALNNLGVALARLGRIAEARACFSRAVALDPSDRDARENLGRAGDSAAAAP